MNIFNSRRILQSHVPAKEFINREKPREIFYKALDSFDKTKKNVIMYYGIGGIGKSSLMKNLKDYTNIRGIPYSFVDFDDPAFRLSFKAIIELKKNLNIPMPHFDVAARACFIKRNPEMQFNDKVLSGNVSFKVIQSLSSLDPTGISSSALGIIEILFDKNPSKAKLDKEIKNDLESLAQKSAIEIENELPDYFAYDVIKFLSREEKNCCIFFFDTYELLWDSGKNDSNRLKNDAWIRRLVSNLPDALFILSGREKVQWELEDSDWLEHISYVPIDTLDRSFAKTYLDNCKIKELPIQEKIIESAKGHPYYLDLCVDTYYRLLSAGKDISVDSFAQGNRDIQECFLKNLLDNEIDTLKVLVIPRFYNRLIFEYLVKAFHTGYSIVKMDDFNSYSFVKQNENDKFFIHILMRNEIRSHMSEELNKSVNMKMVAYYEKQLAESVIFTDEIKYLFAELLYHIKASLSDKELIDYIEQKQLVVIKKLQYSGETNYLLEQLLDLFYSNKSNIEGTEFFSIMIDMIHLSGKYKEAVDIISEYLGSFSLWDIACSEYLLNLFSRKVHHKMFYMPLNTLEHEIVAILDVFEKKETFQLQYCEILFMLGAHIYLPMGDLEKAQNYLVQSIRIAKKLDSNNLICRGLRKFAELLSAKGKFTSAEKICKRAIVIAHSNYLGRYELYLNCVLGEINRLNGITNEAIRLFTEALPIATSMGIKGWVGHIYLSLGNCCTDLSQYPHANKYYEKALFEYNEIKQIWGMVNTKVMIQRLLLISENSPDMDTLNKLQEESSRMGYKTVSKHIENIRNGELNAIRFEFL